MRLQHLRQYIESFTDVPVYPTEFPKDVDEGVLIEVTSPDNTAGHLTDFIVSLHTRAKHPERSEEIAVELIQSLNFQTDINVGDTQIILIRSNGVLPTYNGRDDSGRFYWVTDYRFLIG